MKVRIKESGDATIGGPITRHEALATRLRSPLGRMLMRLQRPATASPRSGNFIPSRWASSINDSGRDVVNLHWIGGDTMSIEDVGRIRKPLVWTLHDMWAFCGSEHVEPNETRWIEGYGRSNRPPGSRGIDIDRLVWHRKRNCWRMPLRIVTPSTWLAECVKRSALLAGSEVSVIPNVIDVDCFKPMDRAAARQALGLPQDATLVLFGAIRARADMNKGYDLLLGALGQLALDAPHRDFRCVVFGDDAPSDSQNALPLPMHWMGLVRDDARLALLYNAADVMVVPSRTENLPQTATEAQASGCPVVAFRCSGLPDAVQDRTTGYLARPYDSRDLASGIRWATEDQDRSRQLRHAARLRAARLWHADAVVPMYLYQYRQALAQPVHKELR